MKKLFSILIIIQLVFSFDLKGQINLQNGLIAYYPFSGNANDETGNGFNASIYGASLADDKLGNADSSFYFDGTNDYLLAPIQSATGSMSYSFSLWFKTNRSGVLITNSSTGNLSDGEGDKRIYINENGVVTAGVYNDGVISISSNSGYNDNQWHHAVLVQDSISGIRFYLDNTLVGTNNKVSSGAVYNWFGIGYCFLYNNWTNLPSNTYYEGKIDDIRIYDLALTDDDVNELFSDSLCVSSYSIIVASKENSTASFNISSSTSWSIECNQAWLTLDNYSGNGNATINITAEENINNEPRIASITITNNIDKRYIVSVIQYSENKLQNGLIAYYPFDGNANDETGNGFNASIYGASLADDKLGNSNSSFSFDGSNDYLLAPIQSAKGSMSYSFSLWFKTDKSGVLITNSPTGNLSDGEGDKRIYIREDGVVTAGVYNDGVISISSNSVYNDNKWHHAVLVQDSISGIKFYLDNTLIGTSEEVSVGPVNYWFGVGYCFMHSNWIYQPINTYYEGMIDDIRIYDQALTDDDVNEIFSDSLNISSNIIVASKENSTASYKIISSTSWSIECNQTWLTFDNYSGNGNDTINITAEENVNTEPRIASMTIHWSTGETKIVSIVQMKSTKLLCSINGRVDPINSGIILGTGSYNRGSTATLKARPSSGYAFLCWTENGMQISTDSIYSFTADDDRTLIANFQETSGINDISSLPEINITPNPVKSLLYINGIESQVSFIIFDTNGKVVINKQIYNSAIDISRLTKGIYFIRISDGKISLTKKIIKL